MILTLVMPPADVPVTIAEIKAHTRLEGVNGDNEDALLAGYLRSAISTIDGRDGWLGRQLMTATWDVKLDRFPLWDYVTLRSAIRLPLPPLQSVTSITYVDPAGASQTLATSLYQVSGIGGFGPAAIVPAFGQQWPDTREQPEAVTVRYVAGYGGANDVPETIRHALYLMVTEAHCDREGEMGITPGVKALLMPYKVHFV